MKKIILISISIVMVLGLLGGIGKFFIDTIYEKRARLIDIQEDISRMEARQQNLKELEKLFSKVQTRENDIENIFVNERSVVRVIETLEAQAHVLGVDLDVESASLPTATLTRGPEIQLRLEGSFDALYRYVKMLEVLPFQLSVNLLNMGKVSGGGTRWGATIQITVLSFISQL